MKGRKGSRGSDSPGSSSSDSSSPAMKPLDSPRAFLQKRGGFNDKARTADDERPASERAPTVQVPPMESGSQSYRLQPDGTPMISPLGLHRLKAMRPTEDSASGATTTGTFDFVLDLPPTAPAGDRLKAAAEPATAPLDLGASATMDTAVALGAAPLSGFRSGRFTPRSGTPRGLAPPPGSTGGAEAGQAGGDDGDDDDAIATSCGGLRAFVMRAPPLPDVVAKGGGGAQEGLASQLPRSFWDACTQVEGADGTHLCWPRGSAAPDHLRFFCFPASLLERLRTETRTARAAPDGFGFMFSFTASDGAVRWGCAVTGAEPGHHSAALVALSVILICNWPLVRPMLDACKALFLLMQTQAASSLPSHTPPPNTLTLPTPFAMHVRRFARALSASEPEVTFLLQHPLWLPTPLAPLLEATHCRALPLRDVLLAALLERPLLLVSSYVSKLMPVAAALAHLLSPLSFSGTFIPFLPAALHPDAETLVNHSPTPFIIGFERHALSTLQPISPHVAVFDVDDGVVSGDDVLAELKLWGDAPILTRLTASLTKFCAANAAAANAGVLPSASERSLQALLLSLMRELLATATQPVLLSSGDPVDAGRAAECIVGHELTADLLHYTSDLGSRDLLEKRILMCRVDSWIKTCARQPQTPTCAFLEAAYQSRTVREFLVTTPPSGSPSKTAPKPGAKTSGKPPPASAGSFADADWLASDLDADQSIREHATALDAVASLVDQRLSSACPELLYSSLLSPRTANFQQRFEVGVNESLLGTFPCALDSKRGLRQGVLHVSTRHACFEAALFAAAYTRIPLTSISAVEACSDPLFHIIPNAIRVTMHDRTAVVFASFQHRDEALELLQRTVGAMADPSASQLSV